MSLVTILNTGLYKITNRAFGPIRNDEGALGAKGNSKSDELVWSVTRNADSTYIISSADPGPVTLKERGTSASPGISISEIEQRSYISVEDSTSAPTLWRLQPIQTASNEPILFVIYQDPRDNQTDRLGHWELNNSDKKEPVKLNRHPNDEENKDAPSLYGGNALWSFEAQPGGTVIDSNNY